MSAVDDHAFDGIVQSQNALISNEEIEAFQSIVQEGQLEQFVREDIRRDLKDANDKKQAIRNQINDNDRERLFLETLLEENARQSEALHGRAQEVDREMYQLGNAIYLKRLRSE